VVWWCGIESVVAEELGYVAFDALVAEEDGGELALETAEHLLADRTLHAVVVSGGSGVDVGDGEDVYGAVLSLEGTDEGVLLGGGHATGELVGVTAEADVLLAGAGLHDLGIALDVLGLALVVGDELVTLLVVDDKLLVGVLDNLRVGGDIVAVEDVVECYDHDVGDGVAASGALFAVEDVADLTFFGLKEPACGLGAVGDALSVGGGDGERGVGDLSGEDTVSYTHLTLPTIYSV